MADSGDPNKPYDADDGEPRRPPSVRESLGPSVPSPAAPRPVRPLPARPARDGDGEGGGDDARPTPVRAAMGVAREEGPPADAPSRTLEVGGEAGERWIVRVEGRAVTGLPPDAGAPLLFLTFAPESDADHPTRQALAVGRALEAYSDAELEALLQDSRPFQRRPEPEEIFPGTRRSRGGRRR